MVLHDQFMKKIHGHIASPSERSSKQRPLSESIYTPTTDELDKIPRYWRSEEDANEGRYKKVIGHLPTASDKLKPYWEELLEGFTTVPVTQETLATHYPHTHAMFEQNLSEEEYAKSLSPSGQDSFWLEQNTLESKGLIPRQKLGEEHTFQAVDGSTCTTDFSGILYSGNMSTFTGVIASNDPGHDRWSAAGKFISMGDKSVICHNPGDRNKYLESWAAPDAMDPDGRRLYTMMSLEPDLFDKDYENAEVGEVDWLPDTSIFDAKSIQRKRKQFADKYKGMLKQSGLKTVTDLQSVLDHAQSSIKYQPETATLDEISKKWKKTVDEVVQIKRQNKILMGVDRDGLSNMFDRSFKTSSQAEKLHPTLRQFSCYGDALKSGTRAAHRYLQDTNSVGKIVSGISDEEFGKVRQDLVDGALARILEARQQHLGQSRVANYANWEP